MKYLSFLLLLFPILNNAISQEPAWQELFDGKSLEGFEQLNGKAGFRVEDGCIVGVSTAGEPNSFLATKAHYDDFILEFEVMVDPALNSGVQIRSNSLPEYQNGRVFGYQVEIDPSPRAFSGGLYDEARRGWLYPLARNVKGQQAFRNGQWNSYRVEAIGHTIKTWVNGVQCAHLADDITAMGFIALQVHSISGESLEGREIRWRRLRILTQNPSQYAWPDDPEVPQISYLVNKLTGLEIRRGWRLLWDGKTSKGWRGAKLSHFPEKGWEIKEGVLTVLATGGGESAGPGDIITTEQFSEFELELEFMITPGANSGIKYFVDPGLNKGAGSAIGCEYQLLDDENHPDAKMGVGGNRTLASLYDLIAADNLSTPGRGKQFKGVGAWNKARVVSRNGKVEHWLNDEKTVEYDRRSQMFRALVAYSKYKDWKGFGQWPQGHILLQDHGNTVHFRSIKIREL